MPCWLKNKKVFYPGLKETLFPTEIEYFQHGPRFLESFRNLAHEIPFKEFRDGYVVSGFSSKPFKLTLVSRKILSFQWSTKISSENKCEYLRIQVTKIMACHR